MPDPKALLERIIQENGGKLVRQYKHRVYQFPNGKVFTCAATPSCPLAYNNAVADLKNLLGVNPPNRGTPGERREKRVKQRSKRVVFSTSGTPSKPAVTWKQKLAMAAKELPPAKYPVRQQQRQQRRPPTFEEQMLRAGVRKLRGLESNR